jgi:hypothetical protein
MPLVKLLSFLAQSFYCAGLMILTTMAALVVSITHYRRHRSLRIFTYYIALSLLADITAFFAFPYPPNWNFRLVVAAITTNAFLLFEFIVCNLFILRYIGSPLRRRIIRINGLLFFGLLIFGVAMTYPHFMMAYYIVLDSIFLVLPCLIYFYGLFSTANLWPLTDQPAFWVVTGILFLHACDIPLQMTIYFLGSHQETAYTLNYILFSVFFILLIRAYLCTPEKLIHV